MLLQVNNIDVSYDEFQVIWNVSISIDKGEMVALLGPNGSGKSTILNSISNLIQPKNGEVLFNNEKIHLSPTYMRTKIGISHVLERRRVFPFLTVKQNLTVYGKLYSVKDLNYKIEDLSQKLRLENFLNRITGELSSGQKNRVSLAKALINDPSVLLLDEPTSSLDPETGDYVRSFLENYKKEKKISVLLASHNMREVERLCDSVLMMKDGTIIDQGTPKNLINKHGRDNLEEVFLKLTRNSNELW